MRLILLSLLISLTAFSAVLSLTGRVVDDASLLNDAQRERLDALLAAHEKATSNQIVVVTVKSLNNKPIEDFGYQLGREWGLGQKEKNNGVLLIVAPNEREVRIEVGYGLEGTLTDAQSKLIIERLIIPQFKKGDIPEGIMQGVQGIIDVLGGQLQPPAPESDEDAPFVPYVIIGIIIIIFIISRIARRRGGPRMGGFSGPFFGGGFGGRSSGGSSRGGFSGGGGSFGGGGASGRW